MGNDQSSGGKLPNSLELYKQLWNSSDKMGRNREWGESKKDPNIKYNLHLRSLQSKISFKIGFIE